ncbi:MAG: hypothetical protein FJ291_23225 [Planctomycetes bacterium]|nr:hypothetical protein [Planctomycetota bacterium]
MAALYEMMRAIRISYQGARAVKDPRMSFHVKDVQSIQYPRDTVWTRRGTCVELAVLYASLLGSVGIEPLLLIKDEHCFTMARLPKSKQPFAVETQGAAGGLPGLPEWQTVDFNRACKMGEEQWTEVQKNGRFVQVDVRDCWQKGILPPKLEALPPAELKGAEILERSDAQREGASAAKSAVARYLEMLIPHACVASQQPMPKAPPAPPTTPPPAA